jgi:hypothetical protein
MVTIDNRAHGQTMPLDREMRGQLLADAQIAVHKVRPNAARG